MAALFPSWADSVFRLVLVGAAGLIVGTPALLMAYVRSPLNTGESEQPDQPVEFDHRHHVRDDGIDCLYCHFDAERAPKAGVPSTDVCMGCHAQVWQDSPLLDPVRRSWFENEPIEWRRVHNLPDFVYFNHSVHVQRGVGCETCHGRVDQMSRVSQHAPLNMGWCLDCHRDPVKNLRPPDAVTVMGWTPDEPQRVVGRRIQEKLGIDPPTDCTTCHR